MWTYKQKVDQNIKSNFRGNFTIWNDIQFLSILKYFPITFLKNNHMQIKNNINASIFSLTSISSKFDIKPFGCSYAIFWSNLKQFIITYRYKNMGMLNLKSTLKSLETQNSFKFLWNLTIFLLEFYTNLIRNFILRYILMEQNQIRRQFHLKKMHCIINIRRTRNNTFFAIKFEWSKNDWFLKFS